MGDLDHPAIEVAARRVRGFDAGLTPVAAVVVHAELVAVLLDSVDKRFTVFVEHRGGEWVAPDLVSGSPLRPKPRADHTPDWRPLANYKPHFFGPRHAADDAGWFSVTGLAALDVVSVSVVSEFEESIVPIREDGLAFAVVRARRMEDPLVYVHTADGRRVMASLRLAG